MRKMFFASAVLLVGFGVVLAEEFTARITKVDGNKVTFYKFDFKKKEKGDETTLTTVDNVKVVKGKFDKDTKKIEAGDAIEGGLKSETFTKASDKGVRAQIVTNDDKKITEIRVLPGFKKKKAGD